MICTRPDRITVIGVLNVTPDSFSDGGRYTSLDAAVAHALRMRDEGADLVDVGGESTRPGAERVPAEVEASRVLPVVRALVAAGVPVSIDTYRASVAAAALTAGASIVNDVSGGRGDAAMAAVVRDAGCPWILMHWRGHSSSMQQLAVYDDVVADVRRELLDQVDAAVAAGVASSALVLDPGLGFAKTAAHNWALLGALDVLIGTGLPVLIGASRKSFLGSLLEGRPVGEREDATVAVTTAAALAGVWGVRVHEVRRSVDAARVVGAIRGFVPSWSATRRWERTVSGHSPDTISLIGLRVRGHHGVFEVERREGQDFVVDVTLALDTADAAATDDLARTVHYGELATALADVVAGDPVDLLETLAARLADVCLRDRRVEAATVTVHKPQAPIPLTFGDVAVTIRRTR